MVRIERSGGGGGTSGTEKVDNSGESKETSDSNGGSDSSGTTSVDVFSSGGTGPQMESPSGQTAGGTNEGGESQTENASNSGSSSSIDTTGGRGDRGDSNGDVASPNADDRQEVREFEQAARDQQAGSRRDNADIATPDAGDRQEVREFEQTAREQQAKQDRSDSQVPESTESAKSSSGGSDFGGLEDSIPAAGTGSGVTAAARDLQSDVIGDASWLDNPSQVRVVWGNEDDGVIETELTAEGEQAFREYQEEQRREAEADFTTALEGLGIEEGPDGELRSPDSPDRQTRVERRMERDLQRAMEGLGFEQTGDGELRGPDSPDRETLAEGEAAGQRSRVLEGLGFEQTGDGELRAPDAEGQETLAEQRAQRDAENQAGRMASSIAAGAAGVSSTAEGGLRITPELQGDRRRIQQDNVSSTITGLESSLTSAIESQESTLEADLPGDDGIARSQATGEQFGDWDWSLGLGDPQEDEVEAGLDAFSNRLHTGSAQAGEKLFDAANQSAGAAVLEAAGRDELAAQYDRGIRDFGAGIVTGVGALGAQVPQLATEIPEFVGFAMTNPGTTANRLPGAIASRTAVAAESALDNPAQFGGSLVGSAALAGGLFSATRGTRVGSVSRWSLQPGEELVKAGVRRGVLGERAARLTPGVRRGQSGIETETDTDAEPADAFTSGSEPLGSGGSGSILDAETVDEAMGAEGPSRRSRLTGGRINRGGARQVRSTASEAERSPARESEPTTGDVSLPLFERVQQEHGAAGLVERLRVEEFMGDNRGQAQIPRGRSETESETGREISDDRVTANLYQQAVGGQLRRSREVTEGGSYEGAPGPFRGETERDRRERDFERRLRRAQRRQVTFETEMESETEAEMESETSESGLDSVFAGATGALAGISAETGRISTEISAATGTEPATEVESALNTELDIGVETEQAMDTEQETAIETEFGVEQEFEQEFEFEPETEVEQEFEFEPETEVEREGEATGFSLEEDDRKSSTAGLNLVGDEVWDTGVVQSLDDIFGDQ